MNRFEKIINGITETGENEQFLLATQPSKKPKTMVSVESLGARPVKTQPNFTQPVKSHINGATTANSAHESSATASPQSGIGRLFPAASQPSKKRAHEESTEFAGFKPLVSTAEPSTSATTFTLEVVNGVGIAVPKGQSVISETVAQPEPTVANKVPEVMQLDAPPVATLSAPTQPAPSQLTTQPTNSAADRRTTEDFKKDVDALREHGLYNDNIRKKLADLNRQNVDNFIARERKLDNITLAFESAEFDREDEFQKAELKRKAGRDKDLEESNKAVIAAEEEFAELEKAQKEEKEKLTKELARVNDEINKICKRTGVMQHVNVTIKTI